MSYTDKIKDIYFLETSSYETLDETQKKYKEQMEHYMSCKEDTSRKLRMLEVYAGIWDGIELLMEIEEGFVAMSNQFKQMYKELYDRTNLQKKCIDRHMDWLKNQCNDIEKTKIAYKKVFYKIQKEIGQEGNKISRKVLHNYKQSLLKRQGI